MNSLCDQRQILAKFNCSLDRVFFILTFVVCCSFFLFFFTSLPINSNYFSFIFDDKSLAIQLLSFIASEVVLNRLDWFFFFSFFALILMCFLNSAINETTCFNKFIGRHRVILTIKSQMIINNVESHKTECRAHRGCNFKCFNKYCDTFYGMSSVLKAKI